GGVGVDGEDVAAVVVRGGLIADSRWRAGQRPVRGTADDRKRERRRFDIRRRESKRRRRVLGGRDQLIGCDRCIIDRRDGDRYGRDVRVELTVAGLEGEAVAAVVVRGRLIADRRWPARQ